MDPKSQDVAGGREEPASTSIIPQALSVSEPPTPTPKPQRPTTLHLEPTDISTITAYPRLPMPTLSEANIDGYFYSMEFWFKASGVADETRKYNTILSQIPPQKLYDLKFIIDNAPREKKYDYIKNQLIAHYADSQQRRLRKVLSDMPLGDQKPSHLYNSMARVANGALAEQALLELSSTRLPPHTHAAVAASEGSVASKLRIADVINESMDLRSYSTVNAVTDIQPPPVPVTQPTAPQAPAALPQEGELIALMRQMNRNIRKQNKINENHRQSNSNYDNTRRNQQFGREGRQARRRLNFPPEEQGHTDENWDTQQDQRIINLTPRRRDDSVDRNPNCWYHRNYGPNASRCRPPCAFNGQ